MIISIKYKTSIKYMER